jgi:hypothetical protein
LQEYALAQHVLFQYGEHIVSGKLVLAANSAIYKHGISHGCCHQLFAKRLNEIPPLIHCSEMLSSMDYFVRNRTSRSIIYWISTFAAREATDPRDKVYGLLGLATGEDVGLVEADYSSSLQEMLYNLTIRFIAKRRNLDILSYVISGRSTQLPSFVPDWINQTKLERYVRTIFLPFYSTSGKTVTEYKEVATGKLAGTGIIVDPILDLLREATLEEIFHEGRLFFKPCLSPEGLYQHTGETGDTAWWLTLCGGMEFFSRNGSTMKGQRLRGIEDFSKFQQWESWFTTPQLHKESFSSSEILMLSSAFRRTSYGRCLISTEKGYFGWAPEWCQKGDVVAVLAGGKVPYVLRPEPTSNFPEEDRDSRKHYSVVGDAYIHGIMDGEVVQELKKSCGDWEEIVLV